MKRLVQSPRLSRPFTRSLCAITRSRIISTFCVASLFFSAAGVGSAAQPEGCPLFLPDFRCDRSGRYEGFVPTTGMPYLFEDPFITTGLYYKNIWHEFPKHSVFQGGDAYVSALQARIAITDRLAFIATKDGYMDFNPKNPLLDHEQGFMDITAGFKYALVDMPESQFILTPSIRYQIDVGGHRLFQGNGDGVFIPAMAFGWGLGELGLEKLHLISDVGAQIPVHGGAQSTSIFYNVHLDYAVAPFLVPFVELNGTHWTNSGKGKGLVETSLGRLPLTTVQAALGTGTFEGADIANLGSVGVAGNELVTISFGFQVPIRKHLTLGIAYERPISDRKDIFKQRVTGEMTLEF